MRTLLTAALAIPFEHGALVSRPSIDRSVVPANVCVSICRACRSTNPGLCANAAGMCRTFIQRSARQRRNSISSAGDVLAADHRGRAVVVRHVLVDDQAALAEVSVIGVRG